MLRLCLDHIIQCPLCGAGLSLGSRTPVTQQLLSVIKGLSYHCAAYQSYVRRFTARLT